MIRQSFAALIALGFSATTVLAQPGPGNSPAAASRAARNTSDEPMSNSGSVVERRSERGAQAGERKISDFDIATAPVQEQAKLSHHTVTVGGRTIPYTATAGTLTLRDDDGKPIASMFYVAYTADRAKGDTDRPVTFLYNGGPGSASLFMHMGAVGPMHVQTDSPGATHSAPFAIVENPYTLLDKSDLVFLDAIGAGYSRPLGDTKGTTFWGVDQDIDAFARGIQRYATINHRWNSPKFLFGESYGTTRSAGLVYALQERGLQFNGVLLLSSVLNYGAHDSGFDHSYVSYVPSYAATAVYWKKAPQPADLTAYLQEVRNWAAGPYLAALTKGSNISEQEFDATAKQLSAYTGLSVDFIRKANLRVDLSRFRKELLRDQHRTLGRYDTRFTGIDADNAGEGPEYDSSDTGIHGAYVAALHDWVERGLGYTTELNYWPSGPGINQAWDWKHKPPGGPNGGGNARKEPVANTAADLGMAMRENPHLMVYSLNGIYDMATPFFGTEYDLAHMWLDPSLRNNVRFGYYPSGHMVYLNQDAMKTMKADVAKFYDEALAKR
ncbi:S10 family peptidase [Phenylobacterium sp.]|uniref:S10 family peptidase n=1 Tax=Phenylobacterium sp. TaxID=1871053 RepID=UPI0035636828